MNTNGPENQDHARLRVQGALTGALYGLLMGTAFVVVMTLINRWLYPEIPFGVNWAQASILWALIGLGLALIGGVTCLIDEGLIGMLVGAALGGFLALGGTLLVAEAPTGMKWIVLVFTLAPMAVFALPVVWVLRRLTKEHVHALSSKWKPAYISFLILISLALGAGSGYFTKISSRALQAMRLVNAGLQVDGEHQGANVSQLAGWQEHSSMRYELFQQKSEFTTEGFDVRARYEDGYTVLCVVNAYPGYDPSIKGCTVVEK
jgi:hypothetical protein